MPKLQIELNDTQLDFLRRLTNLDGDATCIGDVIRKLIEKEADRKNLRPRMSQASKDDMVDTLMNMFGNNNPFKGFR